VFLLSIKSLITFHYGQTKRHNKLTEPLKTLLTGFTEEETVTNSKGPQQSHHYLYS